MRTYKLIFLPFLVLTGAVIILFIAAFRNAVFISPDPTLLLLDRHGEFLAQINRDNARQNGDYGYWPVQHLPKRVVAATLTLEDRRFWQHPGIDPVAVIRAAWQNLTRRRRVSGASTIAMQVARLQHPGPRTYTRKIIETATAFVMTLKYGREQVLKQYLRLTPYGRNTHGIAYASELYFDKPVEDLSWAEIAFLSAIPHSPVRMDPFTRTGRYFAILRGKKILQVLHNNNVMSEAAYALSLSRIDRIHIPYQKARPQEALHFILQLKKRFQHMPSLLQNTPSLLIHTTLDIDLQVAVEEKLFKSLQTWQHRGADHGAVIVTKKKSREILAWVGSSDYFSEQCGAIDFTQVKRSPGSALKPFLYAQAFERGCITPGTILDDLPTVSSGFQNAEMGFLGPMLPRHALANSRNIPAVNLLKNIGIDEAWFFWQTLGLHENEHSADYYGLGLSLGALPISLEQLVFAYGALANEGLLENLVYYIGQPRHSAKRVLSQDIARLITLYLSDPMARLPCFPRMGTTEYPFPAAVKTGTSKGYRDAWCAAYSNDYLVGVWVGRADHKPMNHLGGAGSAAFLAQQILKDLHQNDISGFKDLSFKPPENWQHVEICSYTGKQASEKCQKTFQEWFPKNRIPEIDNAHQVIAIDARNNLRATSWTPENNVIMKNFISLPPRYTCWAADHNIPSPPKKYSPLNIPTGASVPVLADLLPENDATVSITIHTPENNIRILNNPEMPDRLNTLLLSASTFPPVPQVVWYVDGRPYKLADTPYAVRWPLRSGTHAFQVKLPFRNEVSDIIKITVE